MHYINPDAVPYPSEDNPLLSELTKYLETTGLHDPYMKIYITTQPLPAFPCLIFLFVVSFCLFIHFNFYIFRIFFWWKKIAQINKYAYNPSLGAILPIKRKDAYDWIPFVVGMRIVRFFDKF